MKTSNLIKISLILIFIILVCLLNIKLLNIINPINEKYVVKTCESDNGIIYYPYFNDYGLDKKIKEYVDALSKEKGNIEFKLNIVDHKY